MARWAIRGVAALVASSICAISMGQETPPKADDGLAAARDQKAKQKPARPSKPPVKYPLPMITEVHYAVHSGAEGDANGDGDRDAIGDEFVEIINPHTRPIQLKGLVLIDSDAWARSMEHSKLKHAKNSAERDEVRFVFPELELKPGEVAVVFNGYRQNTPGSVGTKDRAAAKNSKFHDAYVFTLDISSKYAAFDNAGDWVMLLTPKGAPVECVRWGQPDHEPPAGVRSADAPLDIEASAQRDGLTGEFKSHEALPPPFGELRFSPGWFDLPAQGDGAPDEKGKGKAGDDGSNEESESNREHGRRPVCLDFTDPLFAPGGSTKRAHSGQHL